MDHTHVVFGIEARMWADIFWHLRTKSQLHEISKLRHGEVPTSISGPTVIERANTLAPRFAKLHSKPTPVSL